MATMSLTKAARLQDRIRMAIRETPIRGHLALGIFVPDPAAELEQEAERLRQNLDLVARLLSILAEVRTISARLTRRAAFRSCSPRSRRSRRSSNLSQACCRPRR